MEKEENQNTTVKNQNQDLEKEGAKPEENLESENNQDTTEEAKEEIKEPTPEEKIAELKDKVESSSQQTADPLRVSTTRHSRCIAVSYTHLTLPTRS